MIAIGTCARLTIKAAELLLMVRYILLNRTIEGIFYEIF
jgi:hypothetical protein